MPGRNCGRGMGHGRGMHLRMLDPVILLSLHKKPAHGYSLIESLTAYGLGQIDISILYRALHQMEDMGWVTSKQEEESSQGPPRRVYRITHNGEQILEEIVSDLELRVADMERFISEYKTYIQKYHDKERI
ncbi:MAG: PadR family transcriptional regulator [Anaerolineaceae bacterium]|jgi:DNA-binding PadR family transcriptional regulator|nr:MAG: PadR family transcriptional regulator [Anaerolineaceae bacterium]